MAENYCFLVWNHDLTFSRATACHVRCNLYTEFDCRPEMIALRDEKFFNTRNSWKPESVQDF